MTLISIIVAASDNNVIGHKNNLPWKLPDDFKRMKEVTMGKPLIMGRKTHESIGRILPGRRNIVITRHPEKVMQGADAVSSLEEAIGLAKKDGVPEAIIFGGGDVYGQALPMTDRIYMTRVHAQIEGDTLFPELSEADWTVTWEERHEKDENHAVPFTFQTIERTTQKQA